jgi:hypothetical protein
MTTPGGEDNDSPLDHNHADTLRIFAKLDTGPLIKTQNALGCQQPQTTASSFII